MKWSKNKWVFLVTAFILCFGGTANARSFSSIIAFGDSLTDGKDARGLCVYNAQLIANGCASAPGVPTSWTNNGLTPYNGNVWVDYLAAKFGATLLNNAIGGAMTVGHESACVQALSNAATIPQLGYTDQVLQYLAAPTIPPGTPNTLFAIWIGGNDCLEFFRGEYYTSDPNVLITDSVGRIITGMTLLYGSGARNFLVLNLPDFGKTPPFRGGPNEAAATGLAVAFNSALGGAMNGFKAAHPGAMVYTFDSFTALNNAIAGSVFANTIFPWLTVDGNCNWTGGTNGNPDDFLFFDCIHPTTAAHQYIANQLDFSDLYIFSNTTDGSTIFTDSSPSRHVITPFGNVHHGDSSMFAGSTAICFDGNGDYLKLAKSDDWNFGKGDFTIDLWVNLSKIDKNYQGIFSTEPSANGFFMCCYQGRFMWYSRATGLLNTGIKPEVGRWYHLAVVRAGNMLSIYVNGSRAITSGCDCACASFDSSKNGFVIGSLTVSPAKSYFNGHMDEIKVCKGIAKWLDDFIPTTPDAKHFTLVETSDIHDHASGYGPFRDYSPDGLSNDSVLGGYARMATVIGGVKAAQAASGVPTLLLDAGDFYMGTTYDMTASNPIALQFFQAMGYDAVTLGNHEFDWGPSGLALILSNGKTNGFTVPVISSNMQPNGNASVNALIAGGIIVNKKIITLPNGIKIGLLGLIGPNADQDAPAAAPVTFDHLYGDIQVLVNNLVANDKVNLVVVLSHGGVENDGTGDDADLANHVSGMDIIASGHYHTAAVTPALVAGSIIISPGSYGKTVGRLDVTYSPTLDLILANNWTLIPVDDSVPGVPAIQNMVDIYNAQINAMIGPALGLQLNSIISGTNFALDKAPFVVTGFGSLCADSLRNVANAVGPYNGFAIPVQIGIVSSGTIRDGIYPGNTGAISFSDAYNALPLGASPYDPSLPGYPLMSIYATGAEVRMICEVGLTLSHMYGADFFLNFSGLQIDYDPAGAPTFSGVKAVRVYSPADPFCTGPSTPIDPAGLYHIAVGLYELQMMNVITPLLPPPGIHPKKADGTVLTPAEYGSARIDASGAAGVQELKEWLALVQYLGGLGPLNPAVYGPGGLATGDLRVNYLP